MARPLTLSTTIGIYAGVTLLSFTLIIALLLGRGLTHVLEDALHDKASALARQLSIISLDAVLIQDYGVLERYTSDLALEADLLYLSIERNDGVVLAQAGSIHHSEDVLTITQPMVLMGNPLGHVSVTYDRTRIRDIATQLFVVAMASVMLLVGLIFWVLRSLLRQRLVEPVKALIAEMNPLNVTQGLSQGSRADPSEVHELRYAFEEMRADIRNQLAEIEKANQMVRVATQRLCQGQRLATIGQMAAGLAHGLNTPLGNIIGYAQHARQKACNERMSATLTVIERQAMACSEIVRNMLSSARAPELMIESFELTRLANGTIKLLEPIARDCHVTIRMNEPDGEIWVMADVASVEQILFNLINNAMQAGARLIDVEIAKASDHVLLSVCDNGGGISASAQSMVFEPFFTTKPASSGTGLGLYLCATLAESMQGRIRLVHSWPGDTCFELTLPHGVNA